MLSLLIWLPILFGLFLVLGNIKNTKAVNLIVILNLAISIALGAWLFWQFDPNISGMQFQELLPWIRQFNSNYALGIDGLSLIFIGLTIVINLVVTLYVWIPACAGMTVGAGMIQAQAKQLGLTFLMQGLLIGIFSATDSLLFYMFWEAILIPLFLLIGIWGKGNRSLAAIKFFLFTFLGSIFLLVAIIYLHNLTNSFNFVDFYALSLAFKAQIIVFIAFFIAFAIKIPVFPWHSWLPDAHSEAPVIGSVYLAAILLKVGIYGFIRFSLPIAKVAADYFAWPMMILSLIAIVYIGFIALRQQDIKRMIAYSSIAHMGVATLGIFASVLLVQNATLNAMCFNGAIIQMVSHALSISGLFICTGMLYKRLGSTAIADFRGMAQKMPLLAIFFMFFILATIGLPGTSGFVGEFLIILTTYQLSIWVALTCGFILVISAGYMLWLFQRIFWGSVKSDASNSNDINLLESLPLLILAGPIILIGLYPQIIRIF